MPIKKTEALKQSAYLCSTLAAFFKLQSQVAALPGGLLERLFGRVDLHGMLSQGFIDFLKLLRQVLRALGEFLEPTAIVIKKLIKKLQLGFARKLLRFTLTVCHQRRIVSPCK